MNPPPRVTLVLPVLNEEQQLPGTVGRLHDWLRFLPHFHWDLVIADNGSTDRTPDLARRLQCLGLARLVRLESPGRGNALAHTWSSSPSDILAYMDVDLATDLRHLQELLLPLAEGSADLATGSRLLPQSRVRRGWRRECLSRVYNHLTRWSTGSRLRDHQCGFKALTRAAARDLLPLVRDPGWFFDTELLVLAQRRDWRVLELPIDWSDDPDSRVRILSTIREDLRGLWRLRRRRHFPQP